MSSDFKGFFRHFILYGLSNILPKTIGFFMMPIYFHFFRTSDYGLIALLQNTMNVIQMIVGFGLAYSILRFYSEDTNPDARDRVVSTSMLFTTFLAVVTVVVCILFSSELSLRILGNKGYAHPFTVMMFVLLFNSMIEIPLMVLRAREKSMVYLWVGVARFGLACVLNILFIVILRMGVAGWLLSALWTSIIICSYLVVSTLSSVRKIRFSFPLLKRMAVYSLPLIPTAFAMFWIHNGDRFILNWMRGMDDVGIYDVGYTFAMMITYLIGQPFFLVWSTRMYYIFEGEGGEKVYARTFTYFALVILMALLFICVTIKEIIEIMSSERNPGYKEAYLIVPLVALGYVFREFSDYFKGVLYIKRRTKYIGWVTLLSAVVSTVLYVILIRHFGRWGAAWTTLATFFTMAAGMYIFARRVHKVSYEFGRLAIMAALGALLYAAIIQLHLESAFLNGVVKGLLSLSFFPILYLLGFFTKEEKGKIAAGIAKAFAVMRLKKA